MLVYAVKTDVGSGKTEINLQNMALKLRQMQDSGDKRACVVAVPTHALGDQQMTRFMAMLNAKGVSAGVWRSREAHANGEPMCFDLGAVKDANEALAEVQTSVCHQKKRGNEAKKCEHFAECRFQKQRDAKPDVMFVPHEIIYGQKPAGVGKPAFLVVDESSWADGLFGCDDRLWLLLDTLVGESTSVPGSPLSTGQLESSRKALHVALAEILHGAGELDDDTRLPAVRAILLKHGLCAETANECYALEWKRKTEAEIYPGMPPRKRKEAVAAVIHNQIVRKLGILWKSVAHLLADNGPEKSGRVGVGVIKCKDGVAQAVFMKGRRDIHDDWQIPTLILDATLQPDLVRHFWPTMQVTADIRIQTPYQHVTQVIDRSYSKTQLGKAAGLRDVHAIICREARRYAGRVLVVVQQEIEEALPGIGRSLPRNVELAHHNAVEGKDQWGPGPDRDGVEALIVVGRTAPSPVEVEKMAEALTGVAIERHQGWYPKASTAREMADGTFRPAESDRHPDAVAEAIRWQIAEGQLVQIIGRARGVNRTRDDPVDILVMTNAPLPIPVEHLISASHLDPSPADLMMAAGGVSFESPTDAANAYPQLWDSRKTAFSAMDRFSKRQASAFRNKSNLITECRRLEYQKAGARFPRAVAWVDLDIVPNPKTWLAERLGSLAYFKIGD
jgi:putative DNA primase/helicase